MTNEKLKLFSEMLDKRGIASVLDADVKTSDAGYSLGVAALIADKTGGRERIGFAYSAGTIGGILYVGYDSAIFAPSRGAHKAIQRKVVASAKEAGLYVGVVPDDETTCIVVSEELSDIEGRTDGYRVA